MRAIYKKIGIATIVLLLGVGSAFLWQLSKQTKQEKRSATNVKLTSTNKENSAIEALQLSDTLIPDQRKRLIASVDEYLKDVVPRSEYRITLENGETVSLKEYLRGTAEYLQKLEEDAAKREKELTESSKFVEFHKKQGQQLSKEIDDLWARWDKVEQEIEAIDEKMEKIDPLMDRLHAFFGTTPNVIPKPPDDATPEEKIAFYKDLQQKMKEDPNYLRSIQPQLTGRSASQTPKTGLFHTLQNAWENSQGQQNDGQSLDTTHFRTNAHSQITSLRNTLEAQYFDVLITPSLTAEEFDNIFPTEKEREILQVRKNEMTQHVVKNIRSFLSDKTDNQKISIVRELLSKNFDKDFADAVIRQLQQEE